MPKARQRNHSVSHHRSLFAPSPILVRRQPRTNAAHAAASPSRRCDHARKSAADAVRIAAEQRPVGSQTLSRPGFPGFATGSNKRSLRVHSRHVLRPDGSNMGVLSSSRARARQSAARTPSKYSADPEEHLAHQAERCRDRPHGARVTTHLLRRRRHRPYLTTREHEVLRLLADGNTNEQSHRHSRSRLTPSRPTSATQ